MSRGQKTQINNKAWETPGRAGLAVIFIGFAVALLLAPALTVDAAIYVGGNGEGDVSALTGNANIVSISDDTNSAFVIGGAAASVGNITITQEYTPSGTGITAANDIRVKVPSTLGMTWDPGTTTVTASGSAAGKISTTVSFANGNKTVIIDVTGGNDFIDGDTVTVAGLKAANFTVSTTGNLQLEIDNGGTTAAIDDKTVSIGATERSTGFTGASGEGDTMLKTAITTDWTIGVATAYTQDENESVTGNVTINGTLDLSVYNPTLTVAGAFSVPASGTFTSGTSTVTLSGTAASYTTANVDKTRTTWSTGSTLFIQSDLSQTLPAGETYGNLYLGRLSGSGLTTFTMGSTINGDWTIYPNTTATMVEDVTVTGNVVINGTLNTAGYNLAVGGNWTLGASGVFTAGTGTVTLNGTDQSIYGSTTFYNLAKTVSAAHFLQFDAGTTQTVTHTLTLSGAAGQLLTLNTATHAAPRFTLDVTGGAQSASYLSVANSQASTNNITTTSSTNAGNNDDIEGSPHWIFTPTILFDGDVGEGYAFAASHAVLSAASAANQSFALFAMAQAMNTLTLQQEGGADALYAVTTDNFLYVTIPSTNGLVWDTTNTSATFGGSASGKVSGVSFPDSHTLKVAVTSNFVDGDTLTIGGLTFTAAARDWVRLKVSGGLPSDEWRGVDTASKEVTGYFGGDAGEGYDEEDWPAADNAIFFGTMF